MAEKLKQFASAAAAAALNLSRPNYFDNGRKGENYELKKDLNSDLQLVRKEAVKKVIASMTIGKDVGALFPDVLKNIQTDDIELKKLVYLYLMNYATSHPELVVLAINTFCKDASDRNPLIRALAIRTMGCLRVDKVFDYLCDPLSRALRDESPYVRKTAAVCVAKVSEMSVDLVEENGFIEALREMLSDTNASVVASVVAALTDIHASNPRIGAFQIDSRIAPKLISVLNDCAEWGQITILDSLSSYLPDSEEDTIGAIEKILPRLQHANGAVVLSAAKVILLYCDQLAPLSSTADGEQGLHASIYRKLAPPLISLLASPPELQFVVLRNLNLVNQKYPEILSQSIKMFFCKFNDPIYVKMEKLNIMLQLVDDDNGEAVLQELAEYAKEVDLFFAKAAIDAVASVAIKVYGLADRCFAIMEQLVLSEGGATMQSVVVSLQKMLMQYSDIGEDVSRLLLQSRSFDIFDDDEARAAYIWILAKYGVRTIDDRNCTIGIFNDIISHFEREPSIVQSELLLSLVRLFLCYQDQIEWRQLLMSLIAKGTNLHDNADLWERCVIYSRLLQIDPCILRESGLADIIIDAPGPNGLLDKDTLYNLIPNIGTVASIYHRIPVEEEDSTAGYILRPAPLPDLLTLDDDHLNSDARMGPDGAASFPTGILSHPVITSPNAGLTATTKQSIIDLLGD